MIAQVAVPRIVESKIESRLEKHGGSASASVRALPVARLAFKDGDSIRARAQGIRLDPVFDGSGLDRLDGFAEVSLLVTDSNVAGFPLQRFSLIRDGDRPYSLQLAARGSLADVIANGAGRAAGPLGGIIGGVGASAIPGIGEQLDIRLDVRLASDDGRPQLVSGESTVNGVSVEPLVELLVTTIAIAI